MAKKEILHYSSAPVAGDTLTGGKNHKDYCLFENAACDTPLIIPGNAVSSHDLSKIALLSYEAARREMAHELHDNVNPLLCVAKIYLDQLTPATESEVLAKKQVMELISEAIQNVKQVSDTYSIFDRKDSSVVAVVNDLIKKIEKLNLFEIDFLYSSQRVLDKLSCCYKLTIHRIIQEQLNNIIKYSKAKHVCVQLSLNKRHLYLQIADDGVGFDSKRINSGIGLRSMKNRISHLGGKMNIDTACGKGCRITVSFYI
ncbi:MAG: hypothetical protein KF862_07550 [Chitinophagaceae bacterium]|nr:hypothetical protein [Chitinophagaceae bacterium]